MLFAVDLDELQATVDELGRCGAALDTLLADVAGRVAALHGSWAGRAGDAQLAAQAEWEEGYREMCAGLAAMRTAGSAAHGSDGSDGSTGPATPRRAPRTAATPYRSATSRSTTAARSRWPTAAAGAC